VPFVVLGVLVGVGLGVPVDVAVAPPAGALGVDVLVLEFFACRMYIC
jgi:hypothetical protein